MQASTQKTKTVHAAWETDNLHPYFGASDLAEKVMQKAQKAHAAWEMSNLSGIIKRAEGILRRQGKPFCPCSYRQNAG